MKNPLEGSSALSTPGLLLGKISSAGSGNNASNGKENIDGNSFRNSLSQSQSEYSRESSKFDGGTYTLRQSGDRKSLIDDGRWLSLDRRGKTSKQSSSLTSSSLSKKTEESKVSDKKRSISRSPSRGKSRERSESADKEQDARSFWVSIDHNASSQEHTSRKESLSRKSQERKESLSSRKSQENSSSKKFSRQSAERKLSRESHEPPVDYDNDYDNKKAKNSKIKRGGQVTKRRKDSLNETKLSDERYSMNTVNNNDYERGTDYPLVKHNQSNEFNSDTLNKKNTSSLSRRGTIYDENINRDGFGRETKNIVATRNRNSVQSPDESKHFLSLQLFNKHAEPSLDEFLPVETQVELEHRQREEEDALYRKFLQERREQEDIVATMEETEREELFERMNKMERSRIINLAEKHCAQMMDLIHREKIRYLEQGGEEMNEILANYPREPPVLQPPQFKKDAVYENNMAVFEVIDETAKNAAKDNWKTFTKLVRHLVGRCSSDVDKARAIFRFITEKKFNHRVWFLYYPEEGNTRGAPTELLRGVEFGIETRALLFKRMCAYAGLHAIVIKGFCKAKDYKPSEEFLDTRWRNAWNAVYVGGGWRLVQPYWAAMSVNTKAAREMRQIYQDHYFLTDADKFIFEFFPKAAEHQFLEHPITMEEFINLPLLRSTFFHFGLGLARSEGLIQATVECDDRGEANIYLNSQNDVSFHYTMFNFKTGSTSVKAPGGKFPLARYVMMSTKDEETNFNIHVPAKGSYLIEIGAARYPTSQECLAQKPIYYINVCKFKIVCKSVEKVMVPLPDCVPGEWGPTKAEKLFGLRGVSHPMPIIYAAPPSYIDLRQDARDLTLNIEFEKTRPVLDFLTRLYKNGVKEEALKQGARYRIKDNYVIFDIKVPQDGQYGLDIYTRENWDDKMLHCCKYLINCDVD